MTTETTEISDLSDKINHKEHKQKRLFYISLCLFLISLLLLTGMGIGIYHSAHKASWDPITSLPPQTLLTKEPINVDTTQSVNVLARKCFSNVPIRVVESYSFSSTLPSGLKVDVSTESRTLDPSQPLAGDFWVDNHCLIRDIQYTIPLRVKNYVKDGTTNWRVTGTIIPYKGEEKGVEHDWYTREFVMISAHSISTPH